MFHLARLVEPHFSAVLKTKTARGPGSLANTDGRWTKRDIEYRECGPGPFERPARLALDDRTTAIKEAGHTSMSLENLTARLIAEIGRGKDSDA